MYSFVLVDNVPVWYTSIVQSSDELLKELVTKKSLYALSTCDGKCDRNLMAQDKLKERLRAIYRQKREKLYLRVYSDGLQQKLIDLYSRL